MTAFCGKAKQKSVISGAEFNHISVSDFRRFALHAIDENRIRVGAVVRRTVCNMERAVRRLRNHDVMARYRQFVRVGNNIVVTFPANGNAGIIDRDSARAAIEFEPRQRGGRLHFGSR
jgi:hypothetical protein